MTVIITRSDSVFCLIILCKPFLADGRKPRTDGHERQCREEDAVFHRGLHTVISKTNDLITNKMFDTILKG